MASPRLTDEAPLVSAYQDAWQNYRNQGLAPLIDAAAAHDIAKFNALIPEVSRLDRQYEIVLDRPCGGSSGGGGGKRNKGNRGAVGCGGFLFYGGGLRIFPRGGARLYHLHILHHPNA